MTLVPGPLQAKCEAFLSLAPSSSDAPQGDNSRNVAMLGALVLLFVALILLRRAFQPLRAVREVLLPVLAAVLGGLLVLAAFVLLITAVLPTTI